MTEQIDQFSLVYNSGGGNFQQGTNVAQSFTAGISGVLTRIDAGFIGKFSAVGLLKIFDITSNISPPMLIFSNNVSAEADAFGSDFDFVTWQVSANVVQGRNYMFSFSPIQGFNNAAMAFGIFDRNSGVGSRDSYFGGDVKAVNADGVIVGSYTHPVDWAFKTFVKAGNLLFDDSNNFRDFDKINPGDFLGPFNDAGGGNDTVTLPSDGGGILRWGLSGGFRGGTGDDAITAGAAGMFIFGNAGNDTITGSTADDNIDGGDGNDIIKHSAGPADDNANDVLLGGSGADIFEIGHNDRIMDFEIGEPALISKPDGFLGYHMIENFHQESYYYYFKLYNSVSGLTTPARAFNIQSATQLSFIVNDEGAQLRFIARNFAPPPLPLPPIPGYSESGERIGLLVIEFIKQVGQAEDYGEAIERFGRVLVDLPSSEADMFMARLAAVGRLGRLVGNGADYVEAVAAIEASENQAREFVAQALFLAVKKVVTQASIAVGARIGAAVGASFGGIGTIPGSLIGAVFGATAGGLAADNLAKPALLSTARGLYDDIVGISKLMLDSVITKPSGDGSFVGTDGADALIGSDQSDIFRSSAGNNVYAGNGGLNDTVDYANAPSAVTVDLMNGVGGFGAAGRLSAEFGTPAFGCVAADLVLSVSESQITEDAYLDIEDIIGSQFDDSITGNAGNNRLTGKGGNDTIRGGAGDDVLLGDDGEDFLVGGTGEDVLSGETGDDLLNGEAGNDLLTGGPGLDTAIFSGGSSNYEIIRANGTIVVRDRRADGDGTDTLTSIERLQFADGLMGLIPEELVLFLPGTRDLITWDSTQGSAGFTYFFRLGANSTVAATADFTGDGRTDVLLSQPGGGLIRWDPTLGGNGFAVLPAAPGFEVIARGDLVGNSATDLLLKNAAGQLRILDPVAGSITDLFGLASGWSVAGVGNINGTGKADVVLQNSGSGAVIAFTDQGWRDLITLGSGWEIAGLGDVTGGLADDFILQRSDGVTIFWDATQGSQGFKDFATIGPTWEFLGFDDLNGDGLDDVVLQNSNGLAIYWTGSNWVDLGSTLAGAELVGTGVFP